MTVNVNASSAYAAVPYFLKNIANWVVWRYEMRGGKETKVPYDPKSTGDCRRARVNDRTTWATFARAAEVADVLSGHNYDGVGFMLEGTELVGIDFDGVLDDGVAELYVIDILEKLGNPYTEISPSGNGLRAFVDCPHGLPLGTRKFSRNTNAKYGAEIYSGSEGGRYLTVTGNRFLGSGVPQILDIALPYVMASQITNEKFKRLWMGDLSDYGDDHSRADLGLLVKLARLFENDAEKMECAFNASRLGQRAKWTSREDYRDRTITKAISAQKAQHGSAGNSDESSSRELEFHLPAVTTGTDYDFVIDPAPGQSDGWFPLDSPSLIGGASGSNKSTWMLQLLLAQKNREPFLNHTTSGRPFLVLMADRGEASHKRTIKRMQLENENIAIKFLSPKMGLDALQEIVNTIEESNPLPQIVFIEGCDMLVEDANKKQIVAAFMTRLQKIAQHFHTAIVGSVGAPKCKAGEGYIAKRDNISGTEAWSRLAETVILLQYPNGKDTEADRELSVLLRNAPPETFMLTMKHGRLEIQTAQDRRRAEGRDRELQWVEEQSLLAETDPTKKWWTVLDLMRALKLPRATAYRWVQHACTKNYLLEKPGQKGRSKAAQFRWNASATNPLWGEEEEEEGF